MSSRRDSRVHLSIRQNDALLEFENFKRKYLLVNKHITKLNSTLSVRVEELNAQVSTLYVENLRLRASEISLVSQLKKEKERTRRAVDEAESAVVTLMGQLSEMRTALCGASMDIPSSPRRRVPVSMVQPPRDAVKLVRPPAEAITQIPESEEEDINEEDSTPTRTVTARRSLASRLPLPKLVATPQSTVATSQSTIPHIDLAERATRRKPTRRNSALLNVAQPTAVERVPSPVTGPVTRLRRRSTERDDEEREIELEIQVGIEPEEEIVPQEMPKVKEVRVDLGGGWIAEWQKQSDPKGKGKHVAADWERETEPHSTSERDSSEGSRERVKEKDKRRCGIKDVTNSPRKGMQEFVEEAPIELSGPISSPILTTLSSTNTELFDVLTPKAGVSLLSPVSTPATDGGSEAGETVTGRERRTRKSVNYAEPKLNTKMRKPGPPPDSSKARTSAVGTARRRRSIPSQSTVLASDDDGDADVEGPGSNMKWMEGRRKTVHNHNTSLRISDPSSSVEPTGPLGESYGHWGDEARRHSMAV